MKDKVLLICPIFFDYHKLFITELFRHGFDVDFISLTLKRNFIEKIINKVSSKILKKKFDKYFERMCDKLLNNQYKKIIVVFGGDYFDLNNILYLRAKFNSRYIFYSWDSVHNYPRIANYYKHFDKYFSFDKNDSEHYGFHFLPLFSLYNESSSNCIYDCSFVGTIAMSKIKSYLKILASLPKELNFFEYLYMPSKFSYFYNLFFHYNFFSKLNKENIHFTPLSKDEYSKLLLDSKVIIDCTRENQNGLTMRTIDSICLNKRIITNNISIANYSFYDEKNIIIIDKNSKYIDKDFFVNLNTPIYNDINKFQFNEWAKIVFEL